MRTYTYETTYETVDHDGAVTGSVELRFSYTYRPEQLAPIDRAEGRRMDPPEPEELEITQIEEKSHGIASAHGKSISVTRWIPVEDKSHGWPVQRDRFEHFEDWAYAEHHDAMVEAASQPADEPSYERELAPEEPSHG